MLTAKEGNYWYHFYNVFDAVLDWGLNLGPPALDTSTLPLGYRGGVNVALTFDLFTLFVRKIVQKRLNKKKHDTKHK